MSELFARLPKVELHLHVAGSVRPDTMREFVERDGLDPILWRDYCRASDGEGLPRYLRRFAAWDATVTGPDRFGRVVRELQEDLAADGIAYAEPRLRPPTDDDGAWDELVTAAVGATNASIGPSLGFIAVLTRGWSTERALREVRRAARWARRGIIGLDVSGDESQDGAQALQPAIALARDAGLNITVHAGEAAGPESVRNALRLFEPARIAHGVRAAEDADLVAQLRATGVHLEMALTSNVQTACVREISEHPFRELLRQGVSVGLNTDNRTISGTTLSAEYAIARRVLGLSTEDLKRATLAALEAAFLCPAQRESLAAAVTQASESIAHP